MPTPTFLACSLASIAIVWIACIIGKGDCYRDFCVGVGLFGFFVALVPLAVLESWLRPLTLDSRLEHIDQFLGLDGLRWARIYWTTAWLRIPLRFAYDILAVMFSLSWVMDRSRTMLRAILIAGLLAFPLYILVPACGPTYAFAGYPLHPIVPFGFMSVAFGTPRNCFPSLHVTWALLMMLNAQSKAWRTVLLAYSIAVGFATVGTGEHYVIDVIAAVPFTFAVQWMVERASVRRPVEEATLAVWNHPAIRGLLRRPRVERSTD